MLILLWNLQILLFCIFLGKLKFLKETDSLQTSYQGSNPLCSYVSITQTHNFENHKRSNTTNTPKPQTPRNRKRSEITRAQTKFQDTFTNKHFHSNTQLYKKKNFLSRQYQHFSPNKHIRNSSLPHETQNPTFIFFTFSTVLHSMFSPSQQHYRQRLHPRLPPIVYIYRTKFPFHLLSKTPT